MRKGLVYRNDRLAGELMETDDLRYVFTYNKEYLADQEAKAISLTLPKQKSAYRSEVLFPFFFNLLSEGVNKKLQSQQLKIDEKDSFGLLLATAQYDTIGPVTVKRVMT